VNSLQNIKPKQKNFQSKILFFFVCFKNFIGTSGTGFFVKLKVLEKKQICQEHKKKNNLNFKKRVI